MQLNLPEALRASESALRQLAAQTVEQAVKLGATGAEVTIAEGEEFSVAVRLGEVETLKEAGSRGAGIRVLLGQQQGSSYTSDLTESGIRQMVESAIAVAKYTEADPFAGLPEAAELGQLAGDLQLYRDDVAAIPTAERIAAAKAAERAAMEFDPRIKNSEGASFDSYSGLRVFANSLGFLGSYASSSCSLSTVPVASEGEQMERDFWYTAGRGWAQLEAPEAVGRVAAQRALRRLGARKVPTQKATIVFDPRAARSLVGHIFEAATGDAIYRKSSFLLDKLGQSIAHRNVTIVDDATLPGLFGTTPFDDEGLPSRRTVVVQEGRLETYLCNSYTGRKLGRKSTGNASRGLSGAPGTGQGNLFLQPGSKSPQEIFAEIGTGLYVTELIGFGVNTVTGDYSRGAVGLWIENGELTFPVSEVTIAGKLQEMFQNLELIGNDLEFRTSTAAPTVAIPGMTISGS